MKNPNLKLRVAGLLVILSFGIVKAQIPKQYLVATWPGFKSAAVSYTFDDNTSNQLPVAMPLFDKYGFKMTLYTVSGSSWNPNWNTLKMAVANGHEVGSHTVSHPVLNSLTVENQGAELQQSKATIEANIPGYKCTTIAYPNCVIGNLGELKKYYFAGRICSGAIMPPSPSDFYNLSSIICGTQGSIKLAADFNNKVASAKSTTGWCVFLIHGIDNDGGWSPVQSTELASHLAFMNDNKSDYWVGTFADVAKYIRERNTVSLTETTVTADSLLVTVNDTLNNQMYNLPVTFKRLLPTGWSNAKVYSGNKIANYSITKSGSQKFVVFDAIPDQEKISIVKSSEILSSTTPGNATNMPRILPNPFSTQIRVSANGNFEYSIHSINGLLVEKGRFNNDLLTGNTLAKGIYFLTLKNSKEYYNTKIIKT